MLNALKNDFVNAVAVLLSRIMDAGKQLVKIREMMPDVHCNVMDQIVLFEF